jgi:ATP-dependent DNA helicase RecG
LFDKTSLEQLNVWLTRPESKHLEFKEAKNQFNSSKDLPDYCAALANEGGGKLILGITDKKVVCGTTAFFNSFNSLSNELLQKLGVRIDVEELFHPDGRLLIFHVPSRPVGKPVKSTGNYTYPMRAGESLVEMDAETLKRIFNETEADFSAKIVPNITLDDIDNMAVDNFKQRWAQKQQRDEYAAYSKEKVLRSIGLLDDDGLTYAALILFGKKEKIDRLLPDSEIIFEWRQDPKKIAHDFRKNWRSPFFSIFDDIWESINARNIRFPYQDGLFQYEVYAFSEKPIREALLNAIAHRDYSIKGQSIFIKVSSEEFSIESPGGFPQGVTIENILVKSVWRNRSIAEVLEKAGLVERSGQGMDDIFRKTISEGKGIPNFRGTDSFTVRLNIPSQVKDPKFILFLEKIIREQQVSFSFEEILELEQIRQNQKLSFSEFKNKFLENGIIEKIGKTKDAKYILSHKYYAHQGRVGLHTKLIGLPRDKYKELIIKHLERNKGYLRDLEDAIPELKTKNITNLLQELKKDGIIQHKGSRKSGYWCLK